MVVFSTLRRRCNILPSFALLKSSKQPGLILKRYGGGHEHLHIEASNFNWKKMLDLFHFYTWIAVIFYGSIILYANVFVGQATLAEIPEGYRPNHWEYYQHPISRFIQRYAFKDPQMCYERFLQFLYEEDEMAKISKLDDRVKELMKKRNDYKAYYYRSLGGVVNFVKEDAEEIEPYMFISPGLTASGFSTNVGVKDSDLAGEFKEIPGGVDD